MNNGKTFYYADEERGIVTDGERYWCAKCEQRHSEELGNYIRKHVESPEGKALLKKLSEKYPPLYFKIVEESEDNK